MQANRNLPDANKLSVITATIMLAYAITPFINLPGQQVNLQLPGFLLQFRLDISTLISVFVAFLAAAGTDWLIQGHPAAAGTARLPNWLLPALTAWVIGVPLTTLEISTQWWFVFALGGVLLILVLVSEYIVVDPLDARQGLASVSLIAVSYALYLILAISVRTASLRLYAILFSLTPVVFLVTFRALFLRNHRWLPAWAAGITLVVGQIAVGLYYLPIRPLQFGLVLLGLTYALTSLAAGIEGRQPWRLVWVEPVVMAVIIWSIALLVQT